MSSIAIQPVSFGPAPRRLIGILHAPSFVDSMRHGVLLCNPFGQEAIRCQRTMLVLADRLARAGHLVLRFDYHGTGDSSGEDLDGDLDGWADDVHQADLELRARCGGADTVWLGMRLGAAAALRAALHAPDSLRRLIVWDPVLDGPRYLARLRERHVAMLEQEYGLPLRPTPAEHACDAAAFRDELLGFAISPRLRRQIEALQPSLDAWPDRPASIAAVLNPNDPDQPRELRQELAQRAQVIDAAHDIDWTGEDGSLVPLAAVTQLARLAAEAA